jgi:hypothetical protein
MFWWKRYEPLLETKPISVEQALVDLLAKELCEMCRTFPPQDDAVDWHDEHLRRRVGGRLKELPTPGPDLVDLVAQLIVWDLQHETEAIDHFFRNRRYGDVCPTQDHVDTLQILWRVGFDALLERKEETHHPLTRADLVTAAHRMAEVYRRRSSSIWLPSEEA